MKRKRFNEEQFIGILKEHEAGIAVSDLCRKHGVSYKTKLRLLDVLNSGVVEIKAAIGSDRDQYGRKLRLVIVDVRGAS